LRGVEALTVRQGLVVPASALSWSAVRASGPGGQNVNKVATKVELRLDLSEDLGLTPVALSRLKRANKARLDSDGRLVVTSQATRSQSANLEDARAKLAALIRAALRPPKKRRPTQRTAGSERRRLGDKRRQSEKKKQRQARFD
jgi:ribosome-associated protein